MQQARGQVEHRFAQHPHGRQREHDAEKQHPTQRAELRVGGPGRRRATGPGPEHQAQHRQRIAQKNNVFDGAGHGVHPWVGVEPLRPLKRQPAAVGRRQQVAHHVAAPPKTAPVGHIGQVQQPHAHVACHQPAGQHRPGAHRTPIHGAQPQPVPQGVAARKIEQRKRDVIIAQQREQAQRQAPAQPGPAADSWPPPARLKSKPVQKSQHEKRHGGRQHQVVMLGQAQHFVGRKCKHQSRQPRQPRALHPAPGQQPAARAREGVLPGQHQVEGQHFVADGHVEQADDGRVGVHQQRSSVGVQQPVGIQWVVATQQ